MSKGIVRHPQLQHVRINFPVSMSQAKALNLGGTLDFLIKLVEGK